MPQLTLNLSDFINCDPVVPPSATCIPLPGGAQICGILPSVIIPDPRELAQAAFGQLNAALAPFMPLFHIFNVLLAIVECVKAIPKSIFPPNPAPVIQCIVGLVQAMLNIILLLPPLTLPGTVRAILANLVAFLVGTKEQIQRLLQARIALDLAQTSTTNAATLAMLACARNQLNVEVAHMSASMAPLNTLLSLVNRLLCLIGAPPVAALSLEGDLSELADLLDPVISFLQTLLAIIPDITPPATSGC